LFQLQAWGEKVNKVDWIGTMVGSTELVNMGNFWCHFDFGGALAIQSWSN